VLLAKTLRSTTFKLALISIGVFGAVAIALFGYVYWSTKTFVLSRSDSVIEAEQAMLRNIYDTRGREGVVRAIEQHKAAARLEGGVYLLANESFVPVTGNLDQSLGQVAPSLPEGREKASDVGSQSIRRFQSRKVASCGHACPSTDIAIETLHH